MRKGLRAGQCELANPWLEGKFRPNEGIAAAESKLPDALRALEFPLSPDKLHDVLAFCDLLVGDSQTMAAEAAVLGTPSIRISSWAGRLSILGELEERYGLTHAFRPDQTAAALAQLDTWLAQPRARDNLVANHQRLLADKIDVADWFTRFIEAGAPLDFNRSATAVVDGADARQIRDGQAR